MSNEGLLFVKPTESRLVRFPQNRARVLKAVGEWVPNNTYWRRRIMGGDVFCASPINVQEDKVKKTSKKAD